MAIKYLTPSEFPVYSEEELKQVSYDDLLIIILDMKNFIKLDIPDSYIKLQNIHQLRAYYRHYQDLLDQYTK